MNNTGMLLIGVGIFLLLLIVLGAVTAFLNNKSPRSGKHRSHYNHDYARENKRENQRVYERRQEHERAYSHQHERGHERKREHDGHEHHRTRR